MKKKYQNKKISNKSFCYGVLHKLSLVCEIVIVIARKFIYYVQSIVYYVYNDMYVMYMYDLVFTGPRWDFQHLTKYVRIVPV